MEMQKKTFGMHANLLASVMMKQAGSIAKSWLEALMNACDSGSTRVTLEIHSDRFVVTDNGSGFNTVEEVETYFGMFGNPHVEGDAMFGKFAAGRGQLYSFGYNEWRSGTFLMITDIRAQGSADGLEYGLTTNLPRHKGCRISVRLYSPLDSYDLDSAARQIEEMAKFLPIPVRLVHKGKPRIISKPLSSVKWDDQTDDAYIQRTRTGELKVYNLGVLVCSYPNCQFGHGGVVVSKRALQVSLSRTEILTYQCAVWRRIEAHLRKTGMSRVVTKAALTKEEREYLGSQLRRGQLKEAGMRESRHLKLFADVHGRYHSFEELNRYEKVAVATAKAGRVATRVHQLGEVFVLAADALDTFYCSDLNELLEMMERQFDADIVHRAVKLETVATSGEEFFKVLADGELPPQEQYALLALRSVHERFHRWFGIGEKALEPRALKGGQSDIALAWTDGRSYVVFGRKELQAVAAKGLAGCLGLLFTLTHEYCHDESSFETHDHAEAFLFAFHDKIAYRGAQLHSIALAMMKTYEKLAKAGGIIATPAKKTSFSSQTRKPVEAIYAKRQIPLFKPSL